MSSPNLTVTSQARGSSPGAERVALGVRYGLTITVDLVAIVMSYGALVALATEAHIIEPFNYAWPVIVVGPELAGGLAVVIAQRTRESTTWSWFLLLTATVVSVTANVAAAPPDVQSQVVHGAVPAVGFIMTKDLCRALRAYLDSRAPEQDTAPVAQGTPPAPEATAPPAKATGEDTQDTPLAPWPVPPAPARVPEVPLRDTLDMNPYPEGTPRHTVYALWVTKGGWPLEDEVIEALGRDGLANSESQAKKIRAAVARERPALPRSLKSA